MELDYTQLSLFSMCPRKYEYVYVLNLENKVGDAALFSSALIHPSLACWYHDEKPDWETLWKDFTREAKQNSDLYTLERAKEIYHKYTTEFASDKDEYEMLASEVTMVVPVGDADDGWITKPDLVTRDKSNQQVGVNDFKASKYATQSELLMFDRQFLGQAEAVGAKWMMKIHIQLLKKETRLSRSWVPVAPELLEEWRAEVAMNYKWIRLCTESGVWPKNAPGSCFAFNMPCEFMDLCTVGRAAREKMLETWPKADNKAYLK